MEKKETGRWTRYGGRFFGWLEIWARWWDWIGLVILLVFVYYFGSWGLLSFVERENQAGWTVTGLTIAVVAVAIVVRWLIYRFVQRRKQKGV